MPKKTKGRTQTDVPGRSRAELLAGNWQPMTTLSRRVDRKGVTLSLSVSAVGDGRWACMALEGPSPRLGQSPEDGAAAILRSHAHQWIGTAEDLFTALSLANEYGERWLANAASLDACACGPLE